MIITLFNEPVTSTRSKIVWLLAFILIFSNFISAQNGKDGQQKMFHEAVLTGSFKKATKLINEGVDVNIRDDDGETTLLKAVRLGNYSAVKFLTEHQADLNAENSKDTYYRNTDENFMVYGRTRNPLMRAAFFKHYQIFKYLLSKDEKTNPDIIYSAIDGGMRYLKLLIEERNFPYQEMIQKDSGYSLLRKAVYSNDTEIIDYLMDLGCNVNASDVNGSLIHSVAYNSNITADVLRTIIKYGVNVHALDNSKESSLIAAVFSKNIEKVKLLNERGVDIHTKNEDGRTALIQAAAYGNLEIVKYLVENGAKVNETDNHGYSPLACAAGSQGMIDPEYKDVYTHKGDLQMVKYLNKKGADYNTTSANGESILMHAAYKGNLELVKYMVNELKIDPKIKTTGKPYPGYTAKNYAEKRGHEVVVQYLTLIE